MPSSRNYWHEKQRRVQRFSCAFRRASGSAFLWPELASDLAAADRPFTDFMESDLLSQTNSAPEHHSHQLDFIEFGLAAALKARIPPERIVNFMDLTNLRAWVKQAARAAALNYFFFVSAPQIFSRKLTRPEPT
jgi:hypothetical protein